MLAFYVDRLAGGGKGAYWNGSSNFLFPDERNLKKSVRFLHPICRGGRVVVVVVVGGLLSMGHTLKQGEYLSIFYNHSHKFGNLHSKRFFFFFPGSSSHPLDPCGAVIHAFTGTHSSCRRQHSLPPSPVSHNTKRKPVTRESER